MFRSIMSQTPSALSAPVVDRLNELHEVQVLPSRSQSQALELEAFEGKMDLAIAMPDGPQVEGHGFLVTFKNLTYIVNTKAKATKTILKDITGYLEPKTMTALMGPSGSGKTTMLDIIAGRKTVGSTTGEVLMGGLKPTRPFLKKYMGYVEQTDLLLGSLTPYEMFMYTAELKLPETLSYADKKIRVDKMISILRLDDCRDTKIGGALTRGISGGQAKRVNIGLSLVTSPHLLLLDEPTSGLDSYTAEEIVVALRAVVAEGSTICATIHSPSLFTFRQFDNVIYLLSGNLVYFGRTGEELVNYFTASKMADRQWRMGDNEAEWLAAITTAGDKVNNTADSFREYYDNTQAASTAAALAQAEAKDVAAVAAGLHPSGSQLAAEAGSGTAVSMLKTERVLFQYRTLKDLQSVAYLAGRIADKLFTALILLLVYAGKGDATSAKDVQSVVGAIFLWVTFGTFGSLGYLDTVMGEKPLFNRERADGLYTVLSYLLAKVVQEVLVTAFGTMLCALLVFYVVDFQGHFIIFWLAGFLTYTIGISAAFFFAAICPTKEVATAAMASYMGSLLYFSGLVLNLNTIPVYLQWYSRIAYTRYTFNALLANQYSDGSVLVQGGDTPREFYGVQDSIGANLGYLVCFAVGFIVLAYISLSTVRLAKR